MGLLYPSVGNFISVMGNGSSWAFTRRVKARMAGAADRRGTRVAKGF